MIELPIGARVGSLRRGVANDYQRKVPAGTGRLAPTYFTSLGSNWKYAGRARDEKSLRRSLRWRCLLPTCCR